jgi:hypothetical protein
MQHRFWYVGFGKTSGGKCAGQVIICDVSFQESAGVSKRLRLDWGASEGGIDDLC